MDLHYLFLEEAYDILDLLIEIIKSKLGQGRRKWVLEIITGKGKNSKNQIAILFPKVKEYLRSLNYTVRNANNGKMFCDITLR